VTYSQTSHLNALIKPVGLFFLLLLSAVCLNAQKKFNIESGVVNFTSNAKLEVIKASSDKIQGLVDPSNGQFAFLVKIQSFTGFNSSLQKEHFNEKYMETEKFYDASFSGKIIEPIDFTKDGVHDVRAKGTLVVHGVRQSRIIVSKIKIDKGTLKIDSNFNILLADHNIKIPTVVGEKIATEISVTVEALMVQK
jgi:hypothetical protein